MLSSLKVSLSCLSAAQSMSFSTSRTGRFKSSVEAENGFRSQLMSSFGDGKYFMIDVCRIFFRCSIISEAISEERGVYNSDKKSRSVMKHSAISVVIQAPQNWIFFLNFASFLS